MWVRMPVPSGFSDRDVLLVFDSSCCQAVFSRTGEREELGGEDDRSLLVTCLIHCADICNPVMGGGKNIQWASLVTQEFNAQVDLEKRCGLPVSVFMDSRTELQR